METALSEDEEDEGGDEKLEREKHIKLDVNKNAENLTEPEISSGITVSPGGPFSALTPSMWPQDIISKLNQIPEDPNSQPDYRYLIFTLV